MKQNYIKQHRMYDCLNTYRNVNPMHVDEMTGLIFSLFTNRYGFDKEMNEENYCNVFLSEKKDRRHRSS